MPADATPATAAEGGGAEAAVLEALFESYAAACRGGADGGAAAAGDGEALFEEGLERVREHLLSSSGDAAACMIWCFGAAVRAGQLARGCSSSSSSGARKRQRGAATGPAAAGPNRRQPLPTTARPPPRSLESIRPQDPVWACQEGCHAAMHLPCVQSWARRALAAAAEKSDHRLSPALFPAAAAAARRAAQWGCPKCRTEYAAVPSGYRCWCACAAARRLAAAPPLRCCPAACSGCPRRCSLP